MSSEGIPTEAELSILKVLWNHGPSTVKEVQNELSGDSGYTTILKFLQIMHEKGIVDREKDGRAHRYWSLLEKEATQQKMLGKLTDQIFDGSIQQLMHRAVSSENLRGEDLNEIEELLKKLKSQREEGENG